MYFQAEIAGPGASGSAPPRVEDLPLGTSTRSWQRFPIVQAATPIVNANGQLVFGNQNWYAHVRGTNEQYPAIRDWEVAEGEFFTEVDIVSASRVIVIGKSVADALFEGVIPIGQTLRLRNLPFRVIGVLEERGQTGMGQDQDDTVLMPYTATQKKLLGQSIPRINQVMLRTVSQSATPVAETLVTEPAPPTPQHRARAGRRFQNRQPD